MRRSSAAKSFLAVHQIISSEKKPRECHGPATLAIPDKQSTQRPKFSPPPPGCIAQENVDGKAYGTKVGFAGEGSAKLHQLQHGRGGGRPELFFKEFDCRAARADLELQFWSLFHDKSMGEAAGPQWLLRYPERETVLLVNDPVPVNAVWCHMLRDRLCFGACVRWWNRSKSGKGSLSVSWPTV